MNTAYALFARFETPTILLSDVCEEFLGLSFKTAQYRANKGSLEIPTFKLTDKTSSPHLVHVDDLAQLIDEQRRKAKAEWQSVQGAA